MQHPRKTRRASPRRSRADRAGLHWTYLGGIERGTRNPALVNIGRIAAALGVEVGELFAGSRLRGVKR